MLGRNISHLSGKLLSTLVLQGDALGLWSSAALWSPLADGAEATQEQTPSADPYFPIDLTPRDHKTSRIKPSCPSEQPGWGRYLASRGCHDFGTYVKSCLHQQHPLTSTPSAAEEGLQHWQQQEPHTNEISSTDVCKVIIWLS